MSTKIHTKNQLARISAKIQQLKKKYPTSSELYLPTEKQNIIAKASLNGQSQQYNSNFEPIARNYLKQRPSQHNSRNSPKENQSENTDRSSKHQQSFVHTEFNPNGRFYEERKYHQSCNKKSVLNKENLLPFSQDLNYQKPIKEYKEELKNLKKEILSSLDFQNFQLSKQKTKNTPKVIKNAFDTFSKNETFNSINNSLLLKQPQVNSIEKKEKVLQTDDLEMNNENFIRIIEQSQKSMLIEEQNTKNEESHLSLQFLNEMVQKLHEDFHLQKQLISSKFEQIDSQSEAFLKQSIQIRNKVQNMESQIKSKQLLKGSEFDMKMVEIQNQSIGKLSKQLHSEIDLINAEINSIKSQLYNQQSVSESERIDFSKQMIESLTITLKQQIMENIQLNNQKYEAHIKELEVKFFRQIFDMKNQIDLMGQKIKKQDYFEKTLRSLVPQTVPNTEAKTEEVLSKMKSQILTDHIFLKTFKQSFIRDIYENIDSKIHQDLSKVQSEVSDQISKEIATVNRTLKEFETKMISYGILLQNVEEGLKQLSNSSNDDQIQIDLINKIKEVVIKEIDSEFGSKQYPLKQSILKQRDSKAFLKGQQNRQNNEQLESQGGQVQICPIVNQRNYRSNEASQVSIFNAQQANSEIWLTSVDDRSEKKMFNSEVRYIERPSLYGSDKGQSCLLDQLVKNSLVFSALNH